MIYVNVCVVNDTYTLVHNVLHTDFNLVTYYPKYYVDACTTS